ncbi:hypothetical protein CYY_003996 [Polysphondylium violaceum]|uniref:Rab GTPase n=1 Tax=Polysphondylium violaceum TaxID=133409 RepID=A0A8J4PY02_9MYCE|nr:hypothetical protein CYY_003996 [Polysphondylium violaceum]
MDKDHHENESKENDEPICLKILVVGKLACGKTSIIQRYCHNEFQQRYKPTIGVDFQQKELEIMNTKVILQLWDIAGQERFNHMTRVYFQNADGAVVVFDATRSGTFLGAKAWKDDIDFCFSDQDLPTILLANKCDLLTPPYTFPEDIDSFREQNKFIKYFYTSAKEDKNINEALEELVKVILQSYEHEKSTQGFKLDAKENKSSAPATQGKTCC